MCVITALLRGEKFNLMSAVFQSQMFAAVSLTKAGERHPSKSEPRPSGGI